MCGLFGMATNNSTGLSKEQADMMIQAAYVDALRGFDSTGIAVLDSRWNAEVHKRALPAADYITSRVGIRARKNMDKATTRIVLGHNRAATIGDVTDDFSHPFHYGHIVGAHNGTLRSRRGLTNTTAPVDSMDLIHAFSAIKPSGYTKMLSQVEGAYALTIADIQQKKLLFVRNTQRPLTLLWCKGAIYWASEGDMLNWLVERNKLAHKDMEWLDLDTNVLYTVDPTNGNMTQEAYEYDPPKFNAPPPANANARGGAGNSLARGANYGSDNPEGHYMFLAEMLRRKILTQEDVTQGGYACNATWHAYRRGTSLSGDPLGYIKARWYFDGKNAMAVYVQNVPRRAGVLLAKQGDFMFRPSGGYERNGKLASIEATYRTCELLTGELVTAAVDRQRNNEPPPPPAPEKGDKIVPFRQKMQERDIDDVSQAELDAMLDKGCGGCDRNLGLGDLDTVAIYGKRAFCGSCSENYEKSVTDKETVNGNVH